MMRLSKLTFPVGAGTKTIMVTPGEWLWFARSLNHEGASMPHNAWTMIQRFAFLYPSLPMQLRNFGDFVRGFSQPVNPRWYPGGDKYEANLARATSDAARNELVARGARRLRIAEEGWDDISPRVKMFLEALSKNQAPSPIPGAIDFASVSNPQATAEAKGLVLLRAEPHENAYFASGGRDSSGYSSHSITFLVC